MKVPVEILAAAETLLAPFGVEIRRLINSTVAGEEKEEYWTVNEVERRFSISRWKLYRARKTGLVKTLKLSKAKGGKVLVSVTSLRAWLKSCAQ